MGRWPTVAGQKEAWAKAKAKLYTIHSKLVSIAAEGGPDIHINTLLADAITAAKRAGVTADVIDRAIRRGAWLDKDSIKVEEVYYEGYAPGGVGIILRALTDNRNRTAPSVRHIFSSYGGNLGETWTVSNFLFDYKWIIRLENHGSHEVIEEIIIESDAEDYTLTETTAQIIVDRTKIPNVRKNLEKAGFTPQRISLEYIPKNFIEVTDFDAVLKIYKMLEAFADDEDIETVWNNADISDELWKQAEEFIESRKFRT